MEAPWKRKKHDLEKCWYPSTRQHQKYPKDIDYVTPKATIQTEPEDGETVRSPRKRDKLIPDCTAPPNHTVWKPEHHNIVSVLRGDIPVVCRKYHNMKRNRSLNTTNGLLAKMKSSYVTTCFGLHLWPSSGYNLVALRVYTGCPTRYQTQHFFNPLNDELNPICHLLALLGAHHIFHISRIRVKSLNLRLLMSYIYGAPILDVSRSHITTQHSR